MRSFSFIVVVLVLSVVSCGGDHGHDHPDDTDPVAQVEPASPAASTATRLGLGLNDRRKWEMDDHTRSAFSAMAKRIASHAGGDAKELGSSLQEDLSGLIEGCTMTGAAHDELHKFLVLYMPAVSALEKSGGQAELERVKNLIEVYPDFFE